VGSPSSTAEMIACMRAAETMRPADRRLYADPFARHFVQHRAARALMRVPPLARAALSAADRIYPGYIAESLLRARFFDETLAAATAAGVRQVVVLGAGYDSTSLRVPDAADVAVYELDEPHTQARKRELLEARLDGERRRLRRTRFVPCDFASQRVSDCLLAAGFAPDERSLVSWLGVTMYLPAEAVDATLSELSELCAPTSELIVDYMHRSAIDGTAASVGARRGTALVAARGERYRFGVEPDDVASWLARYGFELRTHLRGPDLNARYAPERGAGRRPSDFLGVAHVVRAAPGL